MPMFPLGTVLFPGLVLPLHVFEPRYRELVRRCLEGPPEFGVVLIERGSEVGGDDVRTDIGTVARILQAEELPDGRWVLATAGDRRIRIQRWLDDDPYPQAEVDAWPDAPPSAPLDDAYAATTALVRRALALRSELGEATVAATIDLSADPVVGAYQLCAIGPIGPADQQRLLAADGHEARLAQLATMVEEEIEVLVQRLEMG